MRFWQWFLFFRSYGNGPVAAVRKALLIRRGNKVRVRPRFLTGCYASAPGPASPPSPPKGAASAIREGLE